MHDLQLMSILLLAIASNLDNIGVSASYGVRQINIPFTSNLLIAVVTSCGTFLSLLLGRTIYHFLSSQTASLLGGGVIIAVGLWVVFQEKVLRRGADRQEETQQTVEMDAGASRFSFRQILRILDNPIVADRDFSKHIDTQESIALALGLTLNNIPNGVGAGALGLSIPAMTAAVFIFSIVTIWMGTSSGILGFRRLGKSAGLISGLMLILIGIYEIYS